MEPPDIYMIILGEILDWIVSFVSRKDHSVVQWLN